MAVALVPTFNEEHYVASVLVRLMRQADRVIVRDDGSATPSWFSARETAAAGESGEDRR